MGGGRSSSSVTSNTVCGFGRANINRRRRLVVKSRERPGYRLYFKRSHHEKNSSMWVCTECSRIKSREKGGPGALRSLPEVQVVNGVIMTDPEYPSVPHACVPVHRKFVQRNAPAGTRKLKAAAREKLSTRRSSSTSLPFAINADECMNFILARINRIKKFARGEDPCHPVKLQFTEEVLPQVTLIGPYPVFLRCHNCGADITTKIDHRNGAMTWVAAVGLCLIGCVCGCCCVPFRMRSCKDVWHFCPICKGFIQMYHRGGRKVPYAQGYDNDIDYADDDSDECLAESKDKRKIEKERPKHYIKLRKTVKTPAVVNEHSDSTREDHMSLSAQNKIPTEIHSSTSTENHGTAESGYRSGSVSNRQYIDPMKESQDQGDEWKQELHQAATAMEDIMKRIAERPTEDSQANGSVTDHQCWQVEVREAAARMEKIVKSIVDRPSNLSPVEEPAVVETAAEVHNTDDTETESESALAEQQWKKDKEAAIAMTHNTKEIAHMERSNADAKLNGDVLKGTDRTDSEKHEPEEYATSNQDEESPQTPTTVEPNTESITNAAADPELVSTNIAKIPDTSKLTQNDIIEASDMAENNSKRAKGSAATSGTDSVTKNDVRQGQKKEEESRYSTPEDSLENTTASTERATNRRQAAKEKDKSKRKLFHFVRGKI